MMVGVFVRSHAPFAPRQRPKQRMGRPCALPWSRPDSLQQLQQRCTLLFTRFRDAVLQLARRRSSFRTWKHVEDEMLERKHLEDAFALGAHRQVAKGHAR